MKNIFLPLILNCCLIAFSYAEDQKFSIGAGVGALYGNSVGANFNYRFKDRLDITTALGGYKRPTIGLQYHFTENTRFFQPRLSANYGVNGRLSVYDEPYDPNNRGPRVSKRELFYGISAGAGFRLAFGRSRRHGINFDVLLRITDGGLKEKEEKLEESDQIDEPEFGCMGPGPIFASLGAYYPVQLSFGWSYKF